MYHVDLNIWQTCVERGSTENARLLLLVYAALSIRTAHSMWMKIRIFSRAFFRRAYPRQGSRPKEIRKWNKPYTVCIKSLVFTMGDRWPEKWKSRSEKLGSPKVLLNLMNCTHCYSDYKVLLNRKKKKSIFFLVECFSNNLVEFV